jgi:preprotein translocase subunit SecE
VQKEKESDFRFKINNGSSLPAGAQAKEGLSTRAKKEISGRFDKNTDQSSVNPITIELAGPEYSGSTRAKKKLMEKLTTYITESWDEIKNKVTWSKFSELQGSAVLVLVASTIFALVIGAIDWIFKTGLTWFYTEF